MTSQEKITAAYNAGVDEEYNRLNSSPLQEVEYELISGFMTEYISEGSTVIDIGAGPGRYAEFLLSRKCRIGAVDLSDQSLRVFENRINGNYGENFLFSKKACATELEWIDDGIADAVLLMGPLYHLTCEAERQKAVKHSYRILKPGGLVFSVFMSPYPILNPLMEITYELPDNSYFLNSEINKYVSSVNFHGFEIEQFRCWPSYAIQLMEKNGFFKQKLCNIEGVGCFQKHNINSGQTKEAYKKMLSDIILTTCENVNLLGITGQFLFIGKK